MTRNRPTRTAVEDPAPRDECLEDILTLWQAELMDEPEPYDRRLTADLDRLQGAWTTIGGRRQAELLIAGQHLTAHFGDGDIYMGSFTLGTNGPLTTLDIRLEEAPARHRGLDVLCICELKGDTLHWCNASPGETERPTDFDDRNPHLLCLTLRREHRAEAR
jgi:uncharacterized protein (TIGR03067 family)